MDADRLLVLVHIQAGLDRDPSLDALSRESALSPATLQRRIEAATGQTPRRYVERVRLERSASQLQQVVGGAAYAFTTYVGPFSRIGYAYELIGQRFMAHPEMVRHGAAIEWYRTGSIDAERYLNQVDISFPVTARASDARVLE